MFPTLAIYLLGKGSHLDQEACLRASTRVFATWTFPGTGTLRGSTSIRTSPQRWIFLKSQAWYQTVVGAGNQTGESAPVHPSLVPRSPGTSCLCLVVADVSSRTCIPQLDTSTSIVSSRQSRYGISTLLTAHKVSVCSTSFSHPQVGWSFFL